MRRVLKYGIGGGIAVVLTALLASRSLNAQPPSSPLDRQQQARLRMLDSQSDQALFDGDFSRAVDSLREIASLRERWQGRQHWQAVNARLEVKRWEALARLPEKDQKEVARSMRVQAEGAALAQRHRYQAAEDHFRQSLAIKRRVLGEAHAETAADYNNLAINLKAQGKYAQAQPLFEKALAIKRAALGEMSFDTALSYNNLASNLEAQGKYAQALPHLEKALTICRKVLGEEHPHTAAGYDNLAMSLNRQAKYAQAQPLLEKALALRRKLLGEEHLDTALSYNDLAGNYSDQGQYARAQPLLEKALSIWRKNLGEQHPYTVRSYSNLAMNLNEQGQLVQAQPLLEKVLALSINLLGEDHPDTAASYNNLAHNLSAQGRYGQAQPLYAKALIVRRKALGENHPATADGYNNLAGNLHAQGKYAEAQPLLEKARDIRRKVLGDDHPDTAASYNNLAMNLSAQTRYVQAQPLYEKALAITRKAQGEEHPATALSYNNLAGNLNAQGKYTEAQLLYEKALTIQRKVLGEEHAKTASSYNNLAYNLAAQGKYSQAQPLYEKALTLRRKLLGEEHPDTATSYNNLAVNLWKQDRIAGAARLLRSSLPGQEAARFHAAATGFDRAIAAGARLTPHPLLAVALARLGQPAEAFQHAEASLSRGLLDDMDRDRKEIPRLKELAAHLRQLDRQMLPLLEKGRLSPEQKDLRKRLVQQRREARSQLSRLAASVSARQLLPLTAIQKQIPTDAALVLWMDIDNLAEHHACIVRSQGVPVWVQLPGSDRGGIWSKQDRGLADRLYRLLQKPNPRDAERQRLTAALAKQRFERLRPYLGARDQLPAVRRLLVVPTGWVARVPLEVLDSGYRISYVPSGSIYARLQQKHRAVDGSSLLALGDPVFTTPPRRQPKPPSSGLLVTLVQPGGAAARAGLRGGDVLLQLGEQRLESAEDLRKALAQGGSLRYWRQGTEQETKFSSGPLGIRIDRRPALQAVRAWQEAEASLVRDVPAPAALPGTRGEVRALAHLVPGSITLLGSEASEQRLHELARAGKLKELRLLHLATHGIIHPERPAWSALLLARDHLPDPLEQVRQGQPVFTGALRVDAIRKWHLDADLVTLSACKTALGSDRHDDGFLGFAQAFLQSGAHAVLLSRWSADDTATALLMLRFYENLLGKRAGLKKPLPRAEALAEASGWLRQLRHSDALVLASRLNGGKLAHTTRGTEEEWTVAGSSDKLPVPAGDRPYAHPAYWAAFVLVGDAD